MQSQEVPLAKPQGGFAPALLDKVSLILNTVEGIYTIVREVQKKEAEEFTVVRVRTNPNDNGILLDLSGGADVMTFLVAKMPDFMKALQDSNGGEISEEMKIALTFADNNPYETMAEQVAAYALQDLVDEPLDDNHKTYVQQLAPQVTILIDNDLEIVPGE